MSILILLARIGGYVVMPKDVLPEVNIPEHTVAPTRRRWRNGVATYTEMALSNNVNGIRNMESATLQGVTDQFDPRGVVARHQPAGGDAFLGLGRSGYPVGAEFQSGERAPTL
jgi:hypothetical protein